MLELCFDVFFKFVTLNVNYKITFVSCQSDFYSSKYDIIIAPILVLFYTEIKLVLKIINMNFICMKLICHETFLIEVELYAVK